MSFSQEDVDAVVGALDDDLLGAEVLVSTSDIKWSDGTNVQLGTPVYDKAYGRGVISKLTSVENAKPRVEIKWDGGGSYSWETSVLNASMKQVPPSIKVPPGRERSFLTREYAGVPVYAWGVGGISLLGILALGIKMVFGGRRQST